MSEPQKPAAADASQAPGRKLGARMRCSVCGSEAVVTKASATALVSCHGKALEPPAAGARPAT